MALSPDAGAPLDTAASARQPQASDPQEELFVALVAGLRNHVFGKGEGGIVRAVSETDDPGRVIGEMVFAMLQDAIHQVEAKAPVAPEYEMVLGVATEVIDDIAELMEANGLPIDQKTREYALLYAQQLYVENQAPTEDQRLAAQQDLALAKQDGQLDEATKYVQMRGVEAGADPFDTAGMANSGSPRAQGAGLMGGGNGQA